MKVADDGSGDLVVRLHEATGNRVRTTVAAPRRIIVAAACDLLESPQRHFEVSDGIVALDPPPVPADDAAAHPRSAALTRNRLRSS